MKLFAALSALLAACGFQVSVTPGDSADDAGTSDTTVTIDGPQVPGCAELWMYPASNFDPCETSHVIHPPLSLGAGSYTFSPATGILALNSVTVMTLPTSGTSPRVLSLEGLLVPSATALRITGTTPLIIAVHGGASIDGTLSVSAAATISGPGGGTCVAGVGGNGAAGPASWTAGGGGGGGGFGSPGGAGGTGDVQPNFAKTPGGAGLPASNETTLLPLRGGCSGGAGGEEDPSCTVPGTPGLGGGGGGALQLSVRDGLTLGASARLAANGGGGTRGINGAWVSGTSHVGVGGGGGGSGGALLVEGLTVSIASNAMLCANGGSGAGGNHNNDGPVTDGIDGACALSAASGGTGAAASGGNGAFGSTAAGPGEGGSRQDDGGGGGGGGVGRIRVRAATGARPQGFGSSPPAVID